MESRTNVLIVDDEPRVGQYLKSLFNFQGCQAQWVSSGTECTERLKGNQQRPNLVLLDSSIAPSNGVETLRSIRTISPALSVVMMAQFLEPSFVLEASLNGAVGFLQKPIFPEDVSKLQSMLAKRGDSAAARPNNGLYIEELGDGDFFLGASSAMRNIWQEVNTLARTDVSVLITGESGVGKEIIARLIHKNSLRAGRQLLKVNCAALPTDLLESELFGYEAGAFTGAMKSKPGKFEQCDKGTILLDEIGEMSPQLQAKLLQVLQDGQFSRLGARANTKVDVRVLAATNIDIAQAIEDRRFREDLYYRLNAFVIHVPALRDRQEEIPYLLNELSHRLAVTNHIEPIYFSPRMIATALEYHWPGNLRELGNFVKHFLVIRDEAAAFNDLERKVKSRKSTVVSTSDTRAAQAPASDLKSAVRSMKDQTESKMIRDVLDQANWNRRIAADQLQISYKALLYKIRQYNLQVSI